MKKEHRASMPGALMLANTLNQLGPPPIGLMAGMGGMSPPQKNQLMQAQMAGMQAMTPEEMAIHAYRGLNQVRSDRMDSLADKFHNHCPECSRLFINNISCPRCGWRMRSTK